MGFNRLLTTVIGVLGVGVITYATAYAGLMAWAILSPEPPEVHDPSLYDLTMDLVAAVKPGLAPCPTCGGDPLTSPPCQNV